VIEDRKLTARCRSKPTAGLAVVEACDWPHGTTVKKLRLPEKNAESCNQPTITIQTFTVQSAAEQSAATRLSWKRRECNAKSANDNNHKTKLLTVLHITVHTCR